jgi:hypothetical protein
MDEVQEVPGKKRKPRRRDVVAARLVKALGELEESGAAEGVVALNPGFFCLEKIRQNTVSKAKTVSRAKLKGG